MPKQIKTLDAYEGSQMAKRVPKTANMAPYIYM